MKTVTLDEARRLARAVGGEMEVAQPPPPVAPTQIAAPPADRMADAISELARALVLVVAPRPAPTPQATTPPAPPEPPKAPEPPPTPIEEPQPISLSLAQRAASKAQKPRHSYQLVAQRTDGALDAITVARDGKQRYRFEMQPDGTMLVERDGRLCYEVSPQSDDAGLITRLSLTPIAQEWA